MEMEYALPECATLQQTLLGGVPGALSGALCARIDPRCGGTLASGSVTPHRNDGSPVVPQESGRSSAGA
jgi:hypothetical protein